MARTKRPVSNDAFATAPSSSEDEQTESEEEVPEEDPTGKGKGKRTKQQVQPPLLVVEGVHLKADVKVAAAEVREAEAREAEAIGQERPIDLSFMAHMSPQMERPHRAPTDPPMIDYKKGTTDMRSTRYGTDPSQEYRGLHGDGHFWLPH